MTDTFTIDPGGPNETVYTGDDFLIRDSFGKTHSGFADFRVVVPRDRALKDRFLDEVHLETDSEFLFRGFLQRIALDYGNHEAELAGRGIEYELTNGETTRTFSEVFAHKAIETYISEETSFTPQVTTPTAQSSVTDEQAQEADTTAEFNDIVTIADTDPLEVRNDSIEVLQTGFFEEAEDATGGSNDGTVSDGDYSGGSGRAASDSTHSISFSFTTEHKISAANVGFAFRGDALSGTHPAYELKVNGEVVDSASEDALSSGLGWESTTANGINNDLSAGTYTAEMDFTSGTGTIEIDCFHVFDTRFSYTFDNTVDNNNLLDGPELYPDQFEKEFSSAETGWNVLNGTLSTAYNTGDGEGPQRLQLRLGTGTWFPNDGTEDNTSEVTTDFGSEDGSAIQGRFRFSRYGDSNNESPKTGYLGTDLNSWTITFDGDDIAFFDSETVEGSHFQNIRTMARKGNLRFVVPHEKNSKEVHVFRAGDVTRTFPDATIRGEREIRDGMNYANRVTARGNTSGGSRLTSTFQSDSDIATYDTEHADYGPIPELDTQADLDSWARSKLGEHLSELDDKAVITTVATSIDPGFSFTDIPIDDGNITITAPLEEIRYEHAADELRAVLEFDKRKLDLAIALSTIRGDIGEVRRGF